METKASYVLIGAFTLAVLVLTMLFVLWVGKWQLDRQWNEYDVIFSEAVTGLSIGAAVQFNGIQVGDVRRLSLSPDDARKVVARVRVDSNTPVTTGTVARLTFQGLTGVAVIQLSAGAPGETKLIAKAGQIRPQIQADVSALQKLLSSGEDVVGNVNTVVVRLARLLNEDNVAHVAKTVANVSEVTSAIAVHSEGIGQAVDDLVAASAQISVTLARTEGLMTQLEATATNANELFAKDGAATLASAREALDNLRDLSTSLKAVVQNNQGAIDGAAGRGLNQLGPTLVELRATLRELEQAAATLDSDPSALLNGKEQPKEYPIQ